MDKASAGHVEPAAGAATTAAVGAAAGGADASVAESAPAADAGRLTLWEKLTDGFKANDVSASSQEPVSSESGDSDTEIDITVVEPEKPKRQARKLADITEREAKAQAKEAELARFQAELDEYKAALAQLKTDPLGAIEKAGLTYEQLTIEALKGKKKPNPELETIRAEFKKELDGLKSAEQDRQIARAKLDLKAHVEAAGEKYELTIARGDFDRVWETMVEITQQSGGKHIPSFDEAAEFWESQLEKEAEKFMSAKKIKAKLQKPDVEKVEIAAKATAKPVLSNKVGSPVTPQSPSKPRTKAESFASFKQLVDKAYRGEAHNK